MKDSLKVLAVGCSFTFGAGLRYEKTDPELWVNQLFSAPDYTVVNQSKTGANNQWMFLETINEIRKQRYDIVIVGWTAIPRYNFQVGLELYPVDTMLESGMDINTHSHNTISGRWLQETGDRLRKIHNDHWDILTLVKYVNTLIELQERWYNGKIYFVNSLAPWCNNYFVKKTIKIPSELHQYELNLLEADARDDQEIFNLYDMIHTQYQLYGGIQPHYWLNLYNSLASMKIDTVSATDLHPGYQSQQVFVKHLSTALQEKHK